MPTKSDSHDSAMLKVWTTERKLLARRHKKILADVLRAQRAATKELRTAERKYNATMKRIDRDVRQVTKAIERRVGILDGKLGN